ncbi:MAG: hypothetical protein FWE29_04920 [Defluviitaleaceae bacterium]|nr:hypothetical protein [Defluviitaleaceae bacterium]
MSLCERQAARFVKRGILVRADTADVYRAVLNEFSEPCGEEFVAKITGQYYRGRWQRILVDVADKGRLSPRFREGFLAVYDGESALVKRGDMLEINGERFAVVDIHTENGIFVDLSIVGIGS